MVLAPYYRSYELPWEGDEESARRFRRLVTSGLVVFLLFVVIISVIKLPEPVQTPEQAVPDRLARMMVREQPKPPPPPPPKPVEPPKPETRPEPKPEQRVEQARRRAEQSLSRVRDELADLRRDLQQDLPTQTANLSGAVGAESRAERSLISSRAGTGSAGVAAASSSRGFGSGAGSLTGHSTSAVNSTVASIGSDNKATRTGSSGKGSRSEEEIALEFDKQKGALYSLYGRALRERPELQGKMVLEFTIAPSGEVTACRVISSELNDPDLERKIIARVRQIRFTARDVEPIVATKTIEFFPR